MAKVSAGGFRDTTRICNSPVEWGLDVIEGNKDNLLTLIESLTSKLNEIKTAISQSKTNELKDLLLTAKKTRSDIVKK